MVSLSEPSEVRADTTNGDVSITLPATAEPAVSFEINNGDVAINGFEADSTESNSEIDRMIGDGTHRITADTMNGDISIRGGN